MGRQSYFFFFKIVWICYLTVLWLQEFLMRNQLLVSLRIPCTWWVCFSLHILKTVTFEIFTMTSPCLYVYLTWVSQVHLTHFICTCMFFPYIKEILGVCSSNCFCPSTVTFMNMLICCVPQFSEAVFLFSFCFTEWISSTVLYSNSITFSC